MLVNVNIGSNSSGAYKDVEIKFPHPFSSIPDNLTPKIVIMATVELDSENYPLDSHSDRFSVNVANVTVDGFTARVSRLDASKGWDMNLSLNYNANCIILEGE